MDAIEPAMAEQSEVPMVLEGAASADETKTEAAVREADLAALHASSFGWALACCRFDREDAEEVLQTSYLKILDGRARFDGRSSLRTFVFGVVRRTASAHRRLRFGRLLSLGRWSASRAEPPASSTPETVTVQAEDERRLRALLLRLSPRQREVLHLVFYQEMTVEEASEVQRISVGAARTHYERGKAALRRMLREENDR
jgi:RNA polymerase sigma-70 factor (ECF subfamily)